MSCVSSCHATTVIKQQRAAQRMGRQESDPKCVASPTATGEPIINRVTVRESRKKIQQDMEETHI